MSRTGTGEEQWLDQLAERIHNSGLSVVLLPLVEIGRALGFLASQVLLLIQPVWVSLVDETRVNHYVTLLEDPAALERLVERVERKTNGDG
jgi:hypothetical protein